MKQIKIHRLMIGTALVALVLTVSVTAFAALHGLDGNSGSPKQAVAPSATPAIAKQYNTRLTVPAEIPPRNTLRITWSDASANQAAWIGIFKRENNNEHPLVHKSFINLPGGVWEIEAPGELGHYDVRAFLDQGFQTTAIQPFDVTWGTIRPVVSGYPASCYPSVSLVVSYANGPPEINAIVGIFDATNPTTSSPLSWGSLQGKTTGQFVFSAPGYPGRYDVRIVDSAKNVLVRSSAFQVVPASTTIRLNARVESGRVVLSWNNPANYQWLVGYYIYRGTAPGKESVTALTAGPIPTDRTAAASTQTNGYIDTNIQPDMKYYYVLKPLISDISGRQTLGAPSNEVSVQVSSGK